MFRKFLESSVLLEVKLVKSEPFSYHRSRFRQIDESCLNGRTSRYFENVGTLGSVDLPFPNMPQKYGCCLGIMIMPKVQPRRRPRSGNPLVVILHDDFKWMMFVSWPFRQAFARSTHPWRCTPRRSRETGTGSILNAVRQSREALKTKDTSFN